MVTKAKSFASRATQCGMWGGGGLVCQSEDCMSGGHIRGGVNLVLTWLISSRGSGICVCGGGGSNLTKACVEAEPRSAPTNRWQDTNVQRNLCQPLRSIELTKTHLSSFITCLVVGFVMYCCVSILSCENYWNDIFIANF